MMATDDATYDDYARNSFNLLTIYLQGYPVWVTLSNRIYENGKVDAVSK
jgi:hypothetical protein